MRRLLESPLRLPIIGLIALSIIIYYTSCGYYKVIHTDMNYVKKERILRKKSLKTLYIHQGDHLYLIRNPSFNETNASGIPIQADSSLMVYSGENPSLTKIKNSYVQKKHISKEIHFYITSETKITENSPLLIDYNQVQSITYVEYDDASTILVAVGLVILIPLIILLTKSSCPYLYSFNGQDYMFEGEIYSGAVMHNLERHDYLKLTHIVPTDQQYKIKIANELKERQFINLAELIVVNHPDTEAVQMDSKGNIHTILYQESPVHAVNSNGIDQLPNLRFIDSSEYYFNDTSAEKQSLKLIFQKPEDATFGKLILVGKNTEWGDYLYGKFAQKFGNRFNNWMQKQAELSYEERMRNVINSEMPLSVYLKNTDTTELIEHIYMVGPLGHRQMILPLDLKNIKCNTIEITLNTGFMFWQLNYAAMDFSNDLPVDSFHLKPAEVISEQRDARYALSFDDDLHLEQPNTGDQADVVFSFVQCPRNKSQSIFFHSKGYYEHVRKFKGKPDITTLEKFREPGQFSKFSKEEYLKYQLRNKDVAIQNNLK